MKATFYRVDNQSRGFSVLIMGRALLCPFTGVWSYPLFERVETFNGRFWTYRIEKLGARP